MALASDLMGLGMPPLLAQNVAEGGIGPVTITATGTAFSNCTRLGPQQQMVSCSTAGGSTGAAISLPAVGGDTGALIADPYFIGNTTATQTLNVFASTGVTISVGGTLDSKCVVGVYTTLIIFPVSTTLWLGTRGS